MITSAQKLLMARAGVKAGSEPFTFLGGGEGATQNGTSITISIPAGAEVGAVWLVLITGGANANYTAPTGFQDLGQTTNSEGFFSKTLTQGDITQGSFVFQNTNGGFHRHHTALYANCTVSDFTSPVTQNNSITSSIVPTKDGKGVVVQHRGSGTPPSYDPAITIDTGGARSFASDLVNGGEQFGPFTILNPAARTRTILVLLE